MNGHRIFTILKRQNELRCIRSKRMSETTWLTENRGGAYMELTGETLSDDVTQVHLVGRLDILGAEQIDLRFSTICGSRKKVIVDLSDVSFLASRTERSPK